MHAIADGIARGEHKHRLLAAVRSMALQPRESIDTRKADVEDHEIDVGDLQRGIRRLGAGDRISDKSLAAQRLGEAVGEDRIVFDNENSHSQMIRRIRER